MFSKVESDELKKRVRDFLHDDIKKFFFIDYASSKLNKNEIFHFIDNLHVYDSKVENSSQTTRNYGGSHQRAFYKWYQKNLEEIIPNSPNLLVLELPEKEKIDKDRLKKIFDLVESYLLKKMILVSKKQDVSDDLFNWYIKAGMLKLESEQDFCPIHKIIRNSLADTITDWVNEGGDINLQDENKDTLLHLAVENGRVDLVHHLLSLGADVNIQSNRMRTVLHVALMKPFIDIANIIILTHNVEKTINWGDIDGYTALHLAAKLGDVDFMKKLVEKGADVNIKDDFRYVPLMYACKGGKDAVEYLLPLTKDVDIQEIFTRAVICSKGDVICFLVHSGADVNFKDSKGFTPLFSAVGYANISTVKALLYHGADPNGASDDNWTPLHSAVRNTSFVTSSVKMKIIQILLKAGARLDAIYNGKNIVLIAVGQFDKDKDILLTLLENNADALFKDTKGNTALHYAVYGYRTGGTDVIDVLMAQGIDINAKNLEGRTALHLACLHHGCGDVELVKSLISHKADVNIKETDNFQMSPLHMACTQRYFNLVPVVRVLLDAGANVNGVITTKQTPLNLALYSGYEEIAVELLGRGGVLTEDNNSRRESVLSVAKRNNYKKIIEFLSKENPDGH